MSQSRVQTAAGASFAISKTLPVTNDLAGFQALTYTDVGEVVDGGSAGKTYNLVTHSPLAERRIQELKGSYSNGTRTMVLGRDMEDAGQVLLLTQALDDDDCWALRITYQSGDIEYAQVLVSSYDSQIGTIDNIVQSNVAMSYQEDPVYAVASGVSAVSINAAGTGYASDGTFTATQGSTSGVGVNATFTVTVSGGVVTAAAVDFTGHNYVVADTITIAIAGNSATTDAILDVDAIIAET